MDGSIHQLKLSHVPDDIQVYVEFPCDQESYAVTVVDCISNICTYLDPRVWDSWWPKQSKCQRIQLPEAFADITADDTSDNSQ